MYQTARADVSKQQISTGQSDLVKTTAQFTISLSGVTGSSPPDSRDSEVKEIANTFSGNRKVLMHIS